MTDTLTRDETRDARPKRRRRRSRLGTLVFVALLVSLGLVATGVLPVRDYLERENDVDAARELLADLQSDNAVLESDIADLRSEQGIERIARDKYGFVRPGEVGYVVVTPDEPPEASQTSPAEAVEPVVERRSVFQRIWDFVTGRDLTSDG